jgi:hypothetical protein
MKEYASMLFLLLVHSERSCLHIGIAGLLR